MINERFIERNYSQSKWPYQNESNLVHFDINSALGFLFTNKLTFQSILKNKQANNFYIKLENETFILTCSVKTSIVKSSFANFCSS